LIFSTKDRVPCIKVDLKPNLFAYLGGIVREIRGKAYAIDGTADHVHILVSLPHQSRFRTPCGSSKQILRVGRMIKA